MRALDIPRWIVPRLLAAGLLSAGAAVAAGAATLDVLVDSDTNAATGCTVATPAGPFAGVEFIVTTTVDASVSPPLVTGVTRSDCVAPPGTFSSPANVDAGGWSVGVGGGTAGYDVIESYAPVGAPQGRYRLGFVFNDPAAGGDAVLTTDGSPSGNAILLSFAPPAAVPTIAHGALLLLALVLAGSAVRGLRRHKASTLVVCGVLAGVVAGTTWAAIVLDGLVADWTGVPPIATDATGDAANGADIAAAFAKSENGRLYFRADVKTAGPPAITSAASATFIAGASVNFAITTTGNPPVNSITTGGSLPAGVNFSYVPGAATATLTGSAANGSGSTGPYTLNLTASNGVAPDATQALTINVVDVNVAPSFTKGAVPSVLEDAGAQSIPGWASSISKGGAWEGSQTLAFQITGNTNPGLFSVAPAVSPLGTLTYTPAPDAFGSADITLVLHDDGGTANGGADTSPAQVFTINVTSVNDAPAFSKGADPSVLPSAGAQSVPGFISAISPGPANESGQTVAISATGNSNPGIFSVAPTFTGSGASRTLNYTPASSTCGSSTITVQAQDSGDTSNGGVNTTTQTFVITVRCVNQAPSFVKGGNQAVSEDAGAQTVNGWAGSISPGPPSESGQLVDFIVGNDNNALFSVQPVISPSGVLTYTPAANQNGSALVSVRIHDDGGTADGGIDTSAVQTFTITVNAVNDPPTVTAKNYSAQANMPIDIPAASGLLAGASDAADNGVGGCVSTTVTLNLGSISATTPAGGTVAAAADGSFRFTPPPGVTGNVTFTYTIADTGCPGPGVDSAPITVTFNVAGPVIWFVDTAAAGGGNGTLLSRFNTLAAATAAMGSTTNQRIFVYTGTQTSGAGVTLPASGWLVGQGVTGASFDAVMGIAPPAGTVARPAVGLTHPIIQGTVNMNGGNTQVRGLRIQPPASSKGLAATLAGPFTGLVVSDIPNVTTNGARAVDLANVSGTFALTSVNASGADIGINLSSVNPSSGSFAVTGTGGTCTAASPTCSGGTITGSSDTGVKLTSAKNVSLTRMRLNGSTNFGLNGSTVTGLALDTCVFDGSHGGAVDEGALFVTDWLGTGTISGSEILGGFNDNVRVNNTTGVLDRLTISGTTIRNSGNNHGLALYTCLGGGASSCSGVTMKVTVTGSTFTDNSSNHIDAGSKGLAAMDLVISANTFQSANTTASQPFGGAVNASTDHSSHLTFDVDGNASTFSRLTAFNFFISNLTTSSASMTGRFRNNQVGLAGTGPGSVSSASVQGGGLAVTATGAAALVMAITGNTIRNWGGNNAVDLNAGDGGATGPLVDLTLTGNTVDLESPTVNQLHGIIANMGTTSGGGVVTACVDIGGAGLANDVAGGSSVVGGGSEIRFRQRNTSVVRLPGYAGGATDTTALSTYLAARNTTSGTASISSSINTLVSGGAACTQPP